MSDHTDTLALRRIRKISETHCIVKCSVCPKRFGKAEFSNESDCAAWWHWHRAEDVHLKYFNAQN